MNNDKNGNNNNNNKDFATVVKERHPEIFVQNFGKKIVLLPTEKHVELFNHIVNYREANPENDMNLALHQFCQERDADALVKIIYMSRSVDYIIKYTENPKFNTVRAAWESKVCINNY